MAAGDLSAGQRRQIQQSVDLARQICGLGFGVRIGPLAHGRDSALAAHASMSAARRSVLVAVDPASRTVEVVTGSDAGVVLDDAVCDLAVLAMITAFEAGDLVAGLRAGLTLMAEHARAPRVLFLDEPA